MTPRLISTAIALVILACVSRAAMAQRCTGTPTYSSTRISAGVIGTNYRGGSGRGFAVRSVLGNNAFEIEREDVRTRWTEWLPGQFATTGISLGSAYGPQYRFPEEQAQGGPSTSVTYRRSIPTRDGHAALCLVAHGNEARLGYWDHGTFSSSYYRTVYREAALGVALAIPVPISGRLNTAFAFEYRRARFTKFGEDDYAYSKETPAWGHEVVINAGAALPGDWTLALQARTSFFGERYGYPPTWRARRVPVLRLGVIRHFDGS